MRLAHRQSHAFLQKPVDTKCSYIIDDKCGMRMIIAKKLGTWLPHINLV